MFRLPLRNRAGDIINYTYVSKEDYDHLNQYKWSMSYGYASGKINNKTWRLHRYIMIEILKNDIDSHTKIDHHDTDRLNNCRNNLRIVTNSENSRNRKKLENCSSKYTGVSINNDINMWQSSIKIDKRINAFYKNEHHAAHQYNLWCEEFNLRTANLNIIPETELTDFKLYEKSEKKGNLPKNIISRINKYEVNIKGKRIGSYKTLLEAILVKTIKLRELEEDRIKEILSKPIKRNDDGIAIIEIFNRKKVKVAETLVDDGNYYDLMGYNWYLNNGNYICNTELGLIHRYILNYKGKDMVDHRNRNSLDNRKKNLRIVTAKQNAMNKSSAKNSTSKHIGVCYFKGEWISRIKVNDIDITIGYFDSEEEAVHARDIATKEHFGEFGNLNLED
jgi:hypothetical protein